MNRLVCYWVIGVIACMVSATHAAVPYGADSYNDQSEYALGHYVWNIVFMEEPSLVWTQSELDDRMGRIEAAAEYWEDATAWMHPGAQLVIDINYVNGGVPIQLNDIGGEGNQNFYDDALATIDPTYGGNSSTVATRLFNEDMVAAFDTNWAYTSYVKPFEGRASAYINGPLTNAYEDDPTYTYAHESAHIFGALDTYAGSGTRTDQQSGYLYAYNTNSYYLDDGVTPNPNHTPDIMSNFNNFNLTQATMDQIGWTDTDSDTIPDILDTIPTVTSDTSGTDYINGIFNLTVDGTVTPMVSPDPAEGDYTINTLTGAEYRIDNGLWTAIPADDGAWGDYNESFSLNLNTGSTLRGELQVRLYNSVGNYAEELFSFAPSILLGDFNFDGVQDGLDIDGFVLGLSQPDAFLDLYPGLLPEELVMIGDFNGDSNFDGLDIDGFTQIISRAVVVPEPGTLALLAIGGVALRRRR